MMTHTHVFGILWPPLGCYTKGLCSRGGLRIAPQDSGLFKAGRGCSGWLKNWNGFEAGTGEATQCPAAASPLHITPRLTLWAWKSVYGSPTHYLIIPRLQVTSVAGHETLLRQGTGALGPISEAGKGGYILPRMGVPHCPPFLFLRTETVLNLLPPPPLKTESLD